MTCEFRYEITRALIAAVCFAGTACGPAETSGEGERPEVVGTGEQALLDTFHSFRSYNFQNNYVRHQNFLGELTPISTDLDRRDATFKIVSGLGTSDCVSFQSFNFPTYYLRHQNFRLKLAPSDGSALFNADATFCIRPGNADPSWVSFEASNVPGQYIRHQNFHLYIAVVTDQLSRSDTTFQITAPQAY